MLDLSGGAGATVRVHEIVPGCVVEIEFDEIEIAV